MLARLLRAADTPGCMRLKASAGWNQTEQDWLRLFDLASDGCFGIEIDGQLAASTTVVCYGHDLAWIGMVLTLPEYRRRGLARALLEQALAYLDARQVRCVKLDATEMGRPLYEQLGFRVEGGIDRWLRPPGLVEPAVRLPEFDPALDREAFGTDRGQLIAKLASENALHGRPGTNAAYFGPCVARTHRDAEQSLRWFLTQQARQPVYWDILTENQGAVQLAEHFGFQRVRHLHRMTYGRVGVPCDNSKMFAIAGFEYG